MQHFYGTRRAEEVCSEDPTLDASTIILSKDIDKHALMCGSNFNETDVISFTGHRILSDTTFFAFSSKVWVLITFFLKRLGAIAPTLTSLLGLQKLS